MFTTFASLALITICYYALMLGLRSLRRKGRVAGQADSNFSIAELHRLLEKGQLTPEQFEKAKASVLKRLPTSTRTLQVLPADPPGPKGHAFEVIMPTKHGVAPPQQVLPAGHAKTTNRIVPPPGK